VARNGINGSRQRAAAERHRAAAWTRKITRLLRADARVSRIAAWRYQTGMWQQRKTLWLLARRCALGAARIDRKALALAAGQAHRHKQHRCSVCYVAGNIAAYAIMS